MALLNCYYAPGFTFCFSSSSNINSSDSNSNNVISQCLSFHRVVTAVVHRACSLQLRVDQDAFVMVEVFRVSWFLTMEAWSLAPWLAFLCIWFPPFVAFSGHPLTGSFFLIPLLCSVFIVSCLNILGFIYTYIFF